MIICVDYREKKLNNCLISSLHMNNLEEKIKLESQNLPIGDIIIKNEDGKELLIIERKSLSDLASSIRDNRYKEQSFRLNDCDVHNHNIIYLIEGSLSDYSPHKSRTPVKTLWSSMLSILYHKGFSVFRTISINETAECIVRFTDKLERSKDNMSFYEDNNSGKEQNYCSVVKRVKKNNITPENIGEIMLMQIPGISLISAHAIMEEYKTIKNLIENIEKNPKCLEKIEYENKSGTKKRLTKNIISSIYDFLLPQNMINVCTNK
jgi:crossover junction endonuclease MUS81